MIDLFIIKIFFIIVIIFFIIELVGPIFIIRRKGIDPHGTEDNASILTKLSVFSIFIWLSYIILFVIFDRIILEFLNLVFLSLDAFIIIGMILIIISIIFEAIATLNLGLNFRIALPKEETKLITNGIYRIMRNPIVFGLFFLFIGSFLMLPTIIMLIIVIFNIITFNSKVNDEEKFLVKRFGKDYENYMSKVGRYSPFAFRKKKKIN